MNGMAGRYRFKGRARRVQRHCVEETFDLGMRTIDLAGEE